MSEIRNTTADMEGPNSGHRLLLLAAGMHSGQAGVTEFIEAQERAGQQQLVASTLLPTRVNHGTDADFEAVGFTFGKPVNGDTLFRPATLPEGWEKQGSDHDMWSYIVDGLGRQRVSVFYKAAWYDRDAFMSLISLSTYVYDHVAGRCELVADDTWATPEAIAKVALELAAYKQEEVERLTAWQADKNDSRSDYAGERLSDEIKTHVAYIAVAERFAGTGA